MVSFLTYNAPNAPVLARHRTRPTVTRYMVIERFQPGTEAAVYERFARKGRMIPDGLVFIDSWLQHDGERCFQLMETDDYALFDQWMAHWNDMVEFEIVALKPRPREYVGE